MRLKSAGKAKRHPLWSQDQFLDDLRRHKVIKKVCEIYASKDAGWRAYYSDVWRWRKADPDFDATIQAILAGEGLARVNAGRPPLDGGDKSWQATYCKSLVENNLSLVKAAADTPYSVRQIQDMLDPVCSSYDEEFAKEVEAAEAIVSSRAREMMVGLLDEANFADFEQAKITQTKGWVAFKTIEKLEPKKFGRKQVEISGTVDHRHQHRLMPREERLSLLWEDRQKFMERRMAVSRELSAGEVSEPLEITEAEVVEDDLG